MTQLHITQCVICQALGRATRTVVVMMPGTVTGLVLPALLPGLQESRYTTHLQPSWFAQEQISHGSRVMAHFVLIPHNSRA